VHGLVGTARFAAASNDPNLWPGIGQNLALIRHSDLSMINGDNVNKLPLMWSQSTGALPGHEGGGHDGNHAVVQTIQSLRVPSGLGRLTTACDPTSDLPMPPAAGQKEFSMRYMLPAAAEPSRWLSPLEESVSGHGSIHDNRCPRCRLTAFQFALKVVFADEWFCLVDHGVEARPVL
jgi:hypothetical protein